MNLIKYGVIFFTVIMPNTLWADSARWSYDGHNNGQDSWSMLSPDYIKCEHGTKQSPVVISYTEKIDLPTINFIYKQSKAEVSYNNYTIDISLKDNNLIKIGGETYQLTNIRFHSPSEHLIKEKFFPLEIHFLHKNFSGQPLYIAVFSESGNDNNGFKTIIESLPNRDGSIREITLNPDKLLPSSLGYYSYSGSITRPPCTEKVQWRILKEVTTLSSSQMTSIISLLGRNARLEQPIYSRTIKETKF